MLGRPDGRQTRILAGLVGLTWDKMIHFVSYYAAVFYTLFWYELINSGMLVFLRNMGENTKTVYNLYQLT